MPQGRSLTPEEQQLLEMLRASKSPEGAGFDLVARLQALETLVAALEKQHAPETETTPGEEPANEAPPAAEP